MPTARAVPIATLLALPAVGVLSAAECGGPSAAQPSASQAGRAVSESDRLFRSPTSGYRQSAELVVRDAAGWEATWASLTENVAPTPAIPAVDFAREVVVVVALGQRPTGGWTVTIDSLVPQPDSALAVTYTVAGPGPGCMTAQMLSSPAEAVRAPRPTGAVRFVARTVTRAC